MGIRKESGIRPVSPQSLQDHHCKVVSPFSRVGMVPSKEFSSIHSVVRDGNDKSESGIAPPREFLLRLRTCKFSCVLMEEGMEPVKPGFIMI